MNAAVNPVRPGVETLAARVVGYSLLARGFAYPDESVVSALQEAAAAAAPFLAGSPLHELVGCALASDSVELLPTHTQLFTLSSSPDTPTFETAYFSSDPTQQTNRMADIAGFYRAFGVDAGGTGFRPDDISVELEFMSYLYRKQIYATEHLGAPRVAQTKKAQRMFLGEHLGRWAPELGRRVALTAGGSEFYRALGTGLDDWICAEAADMNIQLPEPAGPVTDWPQPGEMSVEAEPQDIQVFELDQLPVL